MIASPSLSRNLLIAGPQLGHGAFAAHAAHGYGATCRALAPYTEPAGRGSLAAMAVRGLQIFFSYGCNW